MIQQEHGDLFDSLPGSDDERDLAQGLRAPTQQGQGAVGGTGRDAAARSRARSSVLPGCVAVVGFCTVFA